MNPLHFNILVDLRTVGKYGQTLARQLAMLRVSGHRSLTEPELEKALRELADKSFVTNFPSALGNKLWRITSLGESALQEEGA